MTRTFTAHKSLAVNKNTQKHDSANIPGINKNRLWEWDSDLV